LAQQAKQALIGQAIQAVQDTGNLLRGLVTAAGTVGDDLILKPLTAAVDLGSGLATKPVETVTAPWNAGVATGEELQKLYSSPQERQWVAQAFHAAVAQQQQEYQQDPAVYTGRLVGHAGAFAIPFLGPASKASEAANAVGKTEEALNGAGTALKASNSDQNVFQQLNELRPQAPAGTRELPVPADAANALKRGELQDFNDLFNGAASTDGSGISSEYQTTEALKQGLAGEKLATDALGQQGHTVLDYKPEITGTNQGGVDIVTMKDGKVYLIDNKAYSTGKNIGDVSALDKNFTKNLADVRNKFSGLANDAYRSPAERQLFSDAVKAIDSGNYQKAVTTAGVIPDGRFSTAVTKGLQAKGFQYINIFSNK
jgi:Holliday junction resolvase-like predicted endonuclease